MKDIAVLIKKKTEGPEWQRYLELIAERPEEFRNGGMLDIITDIAEICAFEEREAVAGRDTVIGVRYRSRYNILTVDLVRNTVTGDVFAYERVIPRAKGGNAVVAVPVTEKGTYILLRQFRHSMRSFDLAFPRGYGEDVISIRENLEKELSEELGPDVEILEVRSLGTVVANSGLSGDRVNVCEARIAAESVTVRNGYEEISDVITVTEKELSAMIEEGKITDGFTLAALTLRRLIK